MPSFFKLNRNKKYNYLPRYYDEKKERLENLKKKYQGEEVSAEHRIRGKFKRPEKQVIPGLFSGATLRTFLILAILILIVIYVLRNYKFDI